MKTKSGLSKPLAMPLHTLFPTTLKYHWNPHYNPHYPPFPSHHSPFQPPAFPHPFPNSHISPILTNLNPIIAMISQMKGGHKEEQGECMKEDTKKEGDTLETTVGRAGHYLQTLITQELRWRKVSFSQVGRHNRGRKLEVSSQIGPFFMPLLAGKLVTS